jgi:hypothetical protein
VVVHVTRNGVRHVEHSRHRGTGGTCAEVLRDRDDRDVAGIDSFADVGGGPGGVRVGDWRERKDSGS